MMASLPAQLILPLLLLLGSCSANLIRGGSHVLKEQKMRGFDYFNLCLLWSGTSCLSVKECCPTNGCCRPNTATGFTIMGFWPYYNDGTWPTCCDGPKFDQNEISDIEYALNMFWPFYGCTIPTACGSLQQLYYAYKWEKHGRCASPVLTNQHEYFSTALMLYFKYNVNDIVFQFGYLPSNSAKYPLEGITLAIQNALKLQDCPSTVASDCPSNVSLPIKNVALPLKSKNYLSFRGVY